MDCDVTSGSQDKNPELSAVQNPVLQWIMSSIATEAVQNYDRNGCYVWGCTNVWHKDYHDG